MVKLKTAAYVLLGFTVSWTLSSFLDVGSLTYITILTSLLLIGVLHELLHLIAINMFRIEHRFVVKGLYIGFVVNVDSKRKYIITALFPQMLTLTMLLLYIFTLNKTMLLLTLLHVAISTEDIGRCLKYTRL